jgi:hypothetical protein
MRTDYPLTVPVVRIRGTVGPPDDLWNDTEIEETETVLVFAFAQVSPQEPVVYGHDRIQVDVQMYAAPGDFLPDDAVTLDAGSRIRGRGRGTELRQQPVVVAGG